jgi:intraflagellar transport protein 88
LLQGRAAGATSLHPPPPLPRPALQGFERREARAKARAATCLAFLALQQGDSRGASAYSDLASKADSCNARALVNKAAALMDGDHLEAALGVLQQALRLEPLRLEALYNMG